MSGHPSLNVGVSSLYGKHGYGFALFLVFDQYFACLSTGLTAQSSRRHSYYHVCLPDSPGQRDAYKFSTTVPLLKNITINMILAQIIKFKIRIKKKKEKENIVVIHFPVVPDLEHRAPFGVSVITHTVRHTVGLLWTSDQPVAETSTYTGQHNI
jgi:hypothetical protein